jgi:hypothetical protein
MGSEGRRNNDVDEDGGNLLALVGVLGRMCERSVTNRGEERAESERRTEKMANEGASSAVLRENAGRKRFL